ncbi:MAG: UDP-N-acetylmuramoyl-tripeptide--D-alanyl-D-alanine ligase [Candidatus Saccharicenans sp.]|nr:UDP-N-acetylmuramoyl-tripeptide--D-alanyl-D-alanine ligase [Candidatus Saccharicenans sp.]MDI6849280.1 UDP-N-acetylmuramoyl-tripeptide--D-alanyl-D-alanine ligase [Candidatus Saccharicenans sp.]
MAGLYLGQVAQLAGGRLLQGRPETLILSYTFDSRQAGPGTLFFALRDRRDGHQFVRDAYEKGAAAACISGEVGGLPPDFGLIKVEDTLQALQALASRWLSLHPVKIVGITGSVGKTSTKEFTACLLQEKFRVLKSPGNFNNQIGVPISILSVNGSQEIAVLEMGMSRRGEIRKLTEIAPPDVAVITGIAPVHLEFFRDLEDIALAKREILEGARPGALAVLNGDDPLLRKIGADWSRDRVLYYGFSQEFQVRAENLEHRGFEGLRFNLVLGEDRVSLRVPFLNRALVSNLLAACAVAFSFGLKLRELLPALNRLPAVEHRGQLLELKAGIKIYDDSYNSNPVALNSVLESLGHLPTRRKIAVLGDMLELGPEEINFHRQAGAGIPENGWHILVTVGPRARHLAEGAVERGFDPGSVYYFDEALEAAGWLRNILRAGDLVLVKGSHGLALDRIVTFLKKEMEA